MDQKTQITCPHCHRPLDVNKILYDQIREDFQRKFMDQVETEQNKLKAENEALAKQKEEFEKKKQRENELFQEKLQAKLTEEKTTLERQLKAKLADEQSQSMAEIKKELEEKEVKLRDFNKNLIEIERLKREKDSLRDQILIEAEQKLNVTLNEEKEKIRKAEHERNELHIRELQKQLDDQKRLTEEMKRKQEQGSMQLQGEVQELAIEEWLRFNFPLDTIDEVKKGVRGGDCLQIVHTPTARNCGTIYYESKRTKDFQANWIAKFKDDIREKGANVGVLVTEVMPNDMDRLGLKDGIWICSYEEFKGLSKVLRESIIQINAAVASQENKGDKMHMLYDFLTSNVFRLQIEAIVEGFTQMRMELDRERRAMQTIWKTREKQIEKVITNTVDMYGSIKGIAGSAIGTIKSLELPEATMEDDFLTGE